MIHINRDRLPFNEMQELMDAAEAAQAEVNAEPDPKKRRELIKKHQDKWTAFRDAFSKLSDHKCWYTESISPGADWDVDHFRPKNRLKDEKTHGGYYWEALNWKNFRLSCHRSNRLRKNPNTKRVCGKADRFPLLNAADRAWTPSDPIQNERPALLDPCDITDPGKLTFGTDGKVSVSRDYEDDRDVVKQVVKSRKILHLDWPAFIDQRIELYNLVFRLVTQGKHHRKLADGGDANSLSNWKQSMSDMEDLTHPDKPYSAAARAYIMTFRPAAWWIGDIVLRIPRTPQAAQGAA